MQSVTRVKTMVSEEIIFTASVKQTSLSLSLSLSIHVSSLLSTVTTCQTGAPLCPFSKIMHILHWWNEMFYTSHGLPDTNRQCQSKSTKGIMHAWRPKLTRCSRLTRVYRGRSCTGEWQQLWLGACHAVTRESYVYRPQLNPGNARCKSLVLTTGQSCGLRPSVLGQDRRSQTKQSVLVLVLQVWCCVVKHGLVTLVVIMILKDTATFLVLFIVSLFCAWNITTVEINSGVHLLKS